MTRKLFLEKLKEKGIKYNKVIFYEKSPYQKRRFKPKYVGWEAWLYKEKNSIGFLITRDDWQDKEYLDTYLEAYTN